jgi:hypothetical protein
MALPTATLATNLNTTALTGPRSSLEKKPRDRRWVADSRDRTSTVNTARRPGGRAGSPRRARRAGVAWTSGNCQE